MAKRVISAVLSFKDQNFSSGLRKANKQAGDFGRHMNVVQNQVQKFNQKATQTFKAVGKAAGAMGVAAVAGLGAAVGKTILDMESSFATLQAQTGASGAELKVLEKSAIQTFSRGYGESLDEVTTAVSRVKQNMQGIDASEISNVTSNALLLAKTFDSDVNEVTRGANNMMQAFGISSQQAFDLFTAGGQRGLNFSNEMFDNVAEYASLFGTMGYSAEEYFGILERGAQSGVYNLDYVNDVMKEFQIRVKDGSKATSGAMGEMSSATQNVWKDFLNGKGTVSDVAASVASELKGMDDQVAASQIAVSLFGTKFEDLESDAVYAMLGTTEAMKGFEGSAASAASAVEGGFVNRIKSSFRELTTSIASLGDNPAGEEFLNSIATTAEGLVPKITSVAEKAMEFGNTIRNNWGPIKETVIGITTAVVAFKVGMMAMSIVSTVTGLIRAYRTSLAAGTVAQWAMNVAMSANPVGLVVAGIAALIAVGVMLYRNWDTVKAKAVELWQKINENPFGSLLLKMNPITAVAQAIYNNFGLIKTKFNEFKQAIQNFKMPAWVSTIGSTISGAASKVKSLFDGSHASGLNRVPFDGYVAELHKGEMVIPERQAQAIRGEGGNINNIDKLIGSKAVSTPSTTSTTTNKGGAQFGDINIYAKGVTAAEVMGEVVPQLKLALANM